jgi:hypothetical protein
MDWEDKLVTARQKKKKKNKTKLKKKHKTINSPRNGLGGQTGHCSTKPC